MRTTHFDATELGLLNKSEFVLENASTATHQTEDGVFTEITKLGTNHFSIVKDDGTFNLFFEEKQALRAVLKTI